jgi:hypothetical protein
MTDTVRRTAPFYDEIVDACLRIVDTEGKHPEVELTDTSYVLPGRTCWIRTETGDYPFWVGINGPRLFFIAWMAEITAERAQEVFKFCFGGAEKVGWQVNYEPLEGGGVSVWANCMTERDKPLTTNASSHGISSTPVQYALTEDGLFWVTDIAMMVQSWIRTSQRHGIKCHAKEPAPL